MTFKTFLFELERKRFKQWSGNPKTSYLSAVRLDKKSTVLMDWKCSVPDKNRNDKNIRALLFFMEEKTAFLLSAVFTSFRHYRINRMCLQLIFLLTCSLCLNFLTATTEGCKIKWLLKQLKLTKLLIICCAALVMLEKKVEKMMLWK